MKYRLLLIVTSALLTVEMHAQLGRIGRDIVRDVDAAASRVARKIAPAATAQISARAPGARATAATLKKPKNFNDLSNNEKSIVAEIEAFFQDLVKRYDNQGFTTMIQCSGGTPLADSVELGRFLNKNYNGMPGSKQYCVLISSKELQQQYTTMPVQNPKEIWSERIPSPIKFPRGPQQPLGKQTLPPPIFDQN